MEFLKVNDPVAPFRLKKRLSSNLQELMHEVSTINIQIVNFS